jgi:hypothetical protein
MRNTPGIAMAVIVFACLPAMGASMSKEEYRDAKKRIAAEYLAERQKCGGGYGHAYNLCVAHAHGTRDVAKAELEAAYKPSASHYYDAAIARAKSAYTIAKEDCEDKKGAEKKACKAEAKVAYDRARAEAKTALAAAKADEAAKRAGR